MNIIYGFLINLFAIFLLIMAFLAFFQPLLAHRFLDEFAISARAHFTEQIIRLMVGFAFILYVPQMIFDQLFYVVGWIIVITSVLLILMPWQWHHKFAQWVIPWVKNYQYFYGLISLALALFIGYAFWVPIVHSK